jgi:hypothetical protein
MPTLSRPVQPISQQQQHRLFPVSPVQRYAAVQQQQPMLFQYKVQQKAAGGLFLAKMLWSNSEIYKYNSNPHKFKSLQVVM